MHTLLSRTNLASPLDALKSLWLVCLLALLSISLLGCRSGQAPTSTATGITPLHRVSYLDAVTHVQTMPLYHQAEGSCRKHRYLEAVHLLDQIIATTTLSSQELAFCQQQRLIGLKDAGLLPKNSPSPPAPSPPPSARIADCGPRALEIVCQKLGIPASLDRLRKLAGTTAKGTSMEGLAKAAQALGLKAEGVQVSRQALADVQTPCLAWINENHYVAVLSLSGDGEQATATIHDPNQPHEQTLAQEELLRLSGGYFLLMHR